MVDQFEQPPHPCVESPSSGSGVYRAGRKVSRLSTIDLQCHASSPHSDSVLDPGHHIRPGRDGSRDCCTPSGSRRRSRNATAGPSRVASPTDRGGNDSRSSSIEREFPAGGIVDGRPGCSGGCSAGPIETQPRPWTVREPRCMDIFRRFPVASTTTMSRPCARGSPWWMVEWSTPKSGPAEPWVAGRDSCRWWGRSRWCSHWSWPPGGSTENGAVLL